MGNAVRNLYEFGPFRLDPEEHILLRGGRSLPLSPKAFETLVMLVEKRGHLVEKNELIKAIWPESFVEDSNICTIISLLRKTLGRDHEYIETVAKHGYRFVAPVTEVPDPDLSQKQDDHNAETTEVLVRHDLKPVPVTSPAVGDSARIAPVFPWKPKTTVSAVAALSVIALSLLAAAILSRRASLAPTAKDSPIKCLAVLPFQTLGEKGMEGYLGLGIADALTTRFGNTGKIVVRPTRTMQKYANSLQDPQVVGRELAVDAVLDGRIQREGDRVRLTAQLIRVRDGVQLWSDTFDERFTNIFTLEDQVSEQVAQSIRLDLTGEEKKRLTRRFTENSDAYQAYLKGRHFWNERTGEGLTKGLGYFRRATEIDPAYSQAYVGIADSYAMLGLYTVLPPNEAFPKAKAAAIKALNMDDGLAEAHATLGFIHFYYDWDGAAAEGEFKRALHDNPNYAMAHSWHGFNLAVIGQLPEAIAEAKQAEQEDPVSPIISTNAAWVFYLAGQYDLAIETLKKAIEIDPNFPRAHYRLGNAYEQKGLYEQAIAEYEKAVPNSGGDTYYQASLGHAYAMAGRVREAREILDHLRELSKQHYVPPYATALIYVGLGDKDRAFEWLEKAHTDRSTSMAYLKVDPTLRNLRSDRRFQALLR